MESPLQDTAFPADTEGMSLSRVPHPSAVSPTSSATVDEACSPAPSTTCDRPDGPLWRPTERERSLLFDPERLRALRDGALLDGPPAAELDQLTRLLSARLQAPLALVTVIDVDRQFLLGATGLSGALATSRQTDLAGSFCKHVLFDEAPLVIPDVTRASRVRGNTSIEALGIGSYLGVPVITSDGLRVGACCVIDRVPRDWSERDVADVRHVAELATALVEGRLSRASAERERREKLDILGRITEGFVTLDREWRVRFSNAEAARLASVSPDEALGRSLWELIPALVDSAPGEFLRRCMTREGVHEYEWEGIANAGWFEMRVVSSAEGLSCYLRDITRRKRSEQALARSEARYRELAALAPVGIFESDASGACTFVNQTWLSITGLSYREALGWGWTTALHPDDVARVESSWRVAAREGREWNEAYRYRRADGTEQWVSGRATALRADDGSVTGYLGTVADVTKLKRVERDLRDANERMELALSGSNTGLWEYEVTSGRVIWSDESITMLGCSRDDLSGYLVDWTSRLHPDDAADTCRALRLCTDGATVDYRATYRLRHRDGSWRWIHAAGRVVERDAAGRATRMMGTHVDVTESRAAERRFRFLFEKLGDPQMLLHEDRIVDCNDAAVRALRVAGKEGLVGRSLRDYYPAAQPDGTPSQEAIAYHKERFQCEGGESYRLTWELQRADGTPLPAELSVARADYDERPLFLVTWRDLTAQQEHERALRVAKEAAEAASRAKSDFLARMSHELRSPLNSVIGFSRLLQRTRAHCDAAGTKEATYLDRIHANGVHLLGLINDLLDISRIESGKLDVERERVDLAELVRGTVAQLEGEASGRALLLRVEAPARALWIETDRRKLRQVLINLVGNAIKFTPEGEVVARVRLAEDGSPEAVEVADTGVGVAPDRLQSIFEPFEQGESGTARRYGGTGLGLAISRQLCQVLGYRLSVASEPGRGSVFRVALRD